MRYDSTPCEPGYFVPSFQGEHVPRIYSTKNYTSGQGIDRKEIIYLVTSFNNETWSYFIYSFLIAAAILTIISILLKRIKVKMRLILYEYCNFLWNIFMLLVDLAPATISKVASQSILWTLMVLATFYGFHCVFFNTLAADLSVPPQVKYIDTLSDLLNDTRFNVTPIVAKQMSVLKALERYRNGTPEKQLYQKLVSNGNESFVQIDYDMVDDSAKLGQVVGNLMERIINGSIALIEDSSLITHCLTNMVCHFKYQKVVQIMESMKISMESFATGPQATIVSKFTDPVQFEVFKYRDTLLREAGMMEGWRRTFGEKSIWDINEMTTGQGYGFTSAGFECADRLLGTSPLLESMAKKVEREEGFNPMGLKFFQTMNIICLFVMIVLATYVLIFEILFHLSKKDRAMVVEQNIARGIIQRTRSNEQFIIETEKLLRPMTSH